MSNPVTMNKPGETVLLMGNEAIVRGALEAGIKIAASYPGTPASEIGNTLAEIAEEVGIHFEWSTNEKVAFEVVYGASMCNQRGLVPMKHPPCLLWIGSMVLPPGLYQVWRRF